MPLFDSFVMVDWSAASRPKLGKDSIWVGVARRHDSHIELADPLNVATRREAERRIGRLLDELAAKRDRILVGFDFPYAYPRGFADALGCPRPDPPWRAIWHLLTSELQDGDRNDNNRFQVASAMNARVGPEPGPFWGCPSKRETSFLRARRKGSWDFPYPVSSRSWLARLRETEERMQGVQEAWKLLGAGSVGSQALTGIPCVARLRDRPSLATFSRVWPFETGFVPQPLPDAGGPFILHAEIWPGVVDRDEALHPVRDAAQVSSLARHLARLDAEDRLGSWFAEPACLDPGPRNACVDEEGWILGCQAAVTGPAQLV